MDKNFCIFDLDGTLVDSMGWWQSMEYDYLTAHGAQPGPALEELCDRLKPMTLHDAAKIFVAELHFDIDPEQVIAEMNAIMIDNYRHRIPLKPCVENYLRAQKQRGAKLGTASATRVDIVRATLERLGVAELFEFMISCEDVHASKDRPDVYFEAARRLGAAPADTAVFEDSLTALTTAKNAGFYCVAVYDETSKDSWPLLQSLGDECIVDWNEAALNL